MIWRDFVGLCDEVGCWIRVWVGKSVVCWKVGFIKGVGVIIWGMIGDRIRWCFVIVIMEVWVEGVVEVVC